MSYRRHERLCGLAGIVYALLHVVVGVMLVSFDYPPSPDASAEEIAEVVAGHRAMFLATLLVEGVAYGLLFVFLAGLRSWIYEQAGPVLAGMVFGAGLLAGAFILVEDALLVATAFRKGLDPEVAVGLRDAAFATARIFARYPEAVVMGAIAASAGVPRDLRLLAGLAAIGCLSVTPTVFFDEGTYSLHSTLHYAVATGPFLVVLGALGAHLLRGGGDLEVGRASSR